MADQEAREAVLTLSDSRGRQLVQVDSVNAAIAPPWPPEEVHWVADAQDLLRIDLTLTVPAGYRGPCGLRLVEQRRATPADRRRTEAEAELARGHALRRTWQPAQCRGGIAAYETAQRRFAELGLPRRRAEALLGLGELESDCLHETWAALQVFTRAEPSFAGDPAYESTVRQYLGELRFARGDLDGAIRDYRRALTLRRGLGDRSGEALTATALGHALDLRGRYDEAAVLFDRAMTLWQPRDDAGKQAQTRLNAGELHRELGEVGKAGEQFREALRLSRLARSHGYEAAALNALGLVALDADQPGLALEPLRGALALRSPQSRGWAVTRTALGVAYRGLRRFEDARQAYAEALPIYRRVGDVHEEARCLGNLGRLEASTGRDASARDHLDRAIGLFRTLGDPPALAWALEGKARLVHRRGDLAAARELMEEALTAIERQRFRQTSYTTRADFFSTRQDSYGFLIDVLMEMDRKAPGNGYAAAALKVSERSLARSLLDGLAAAGMDLHRRGGAAPELHSRERELEKDIDTLVSRQTDLSQENPDPARLQEVEADLGRRWSDLDRVRAALRAGDPRYAALTQPQPWSAAQVQHDLLDRDTLLLEYRLGETRSFLWAVASDGLKSFVLPGRRQIEKVARAACGLLAHSANAQAEISAGLQLAELSRMLLGPAADLLPGKRLLVVGDGVLQSLPFAALPEPEAGGGDPLITHHEVVVLPSASVLGVLRQEIASRPPAPKTLWILANPDFGLLFQPLPHTAQEAAAILELGPASGDLMLQGRDATRAAVLSSPLRDYRFLHFATHGSFSPADPGGGRLLLAQIDARGRRQANGFLYLADIYEMRLRADLVVLSACQSAVGREVRGEGIMGMTRGFFYAGAERVLVSLWNVNDRSTAELMRHLYHGILVEHLSPAAALRAAQNAIRQRWRAPYYWAGFTLQGEWR